MEAYDGCYLSAMVVTSSDGQAKAKRYSPAIGNGLCYSKALVFKVGQCHQLTLLQAKTTLDLGMRIADFQLTNWVIAVTENGWTNERGMRWILRSTQSPGLQYWWLSLYSLQRS